MKSRYLSVNFTGGNYNQIQHLISLILAKQLYPLSEITFNTSENRYEAEEGVDLSLYYLPVTGFNKDCLLFWRKTLDATILTAETGELATFITAMKSTYGYSSVTATFSIVSINDYNSFVDIRKYATSVNVHPEAPYYPLARTSAD